MLYIIATPIGNLSDISTRALSTLAEVDFVLCEDTRVTKKLLNSYEIDTPTISYHQHSKPKKVKEIIGLLEEGKTLALVTDAGTPGISDPGGKLVEEVVVHFGDELKIVPIPGPSAVMTALSASGFPADRFVFLGFPPHKKGRNKFFDMMALQGHTTIIFESTHRIIKTLNEIDKRLPNKKIIVGRELTKIYETIYRGTTSKVINQIEDSSKKGEFVIVISNLEA